MTARFIERICPLCYSSTPKTRQTSAALRINENMSLFIHVSAVKITLFHAMAKIGAHPSGVTVDDIVLV